MELPHRRSLNVSLSFFQWQETPVPVSEDGSQMTDAQEIKQRRQRWEFLVGLHCSPLLSCIQRVGVLTYHNGLDALAGGGPLDTTEWLDIHTFHRLLPPGTFLCLKSWHSTPSNSCSPSQTESWRKERKELGVQQCPRRRPPQVWWSSVDHPWPLPSSLPLHGHVQPLYSSWAKLLNHRKLCPGQRAEIQ